MERRAARRRDTVYFSVPHRQGCSRFDAHHHHHLVASHHELRASRPRCTPGGECTRRRYCRCSLEWADTKGSAIWRVADWIRATALFVYRPPAIGDNSVIGRRERGRERIFLELSENFVVCFRVSIIFIGCDVLTNVSLAGKRKERIWLLYLAKVEREQYGKYVFMCIQIR